MILKCQVVTITRNRKGQPVRAARVVAGDPITLGRSAEASIHLPDPRVHLHHALIRNNDLGKLYLEGQDAAIDVNGELQSRAKLRRGAQILIGPYRIIPEPPTGPDHDFGLAIELVQPFPQDLGDLRARSRTSLSATWLPKRSVAWAAFAMVALLSLALPIAYATSPRFREKAAGSLPASVGRVAWDVAWDPGPLSAGHQTLSLRCDACHQAPFERVPDRACVKCHAATGSHVKEAAVSRGVFLDARCAECHREHKGERALARTDAALCVDCHGEIEARFPKSTLAAVSDFASAHPSFALYMVNARTGETERVAADQASSRVEESGLKFPHATHLNPKGVRTPRGPRVLECAQCHRPDLLGVRFEPVKMVEDCSECHRLEFEPAQSTRQAPHGKPEEILISLREFYARIALGDRAIDVTLVNDLLRRPIADVTRLEHRKALAWAEQKAQAVATNLIEVRVCVQCHQVRRETDRVAPAAGSEGGLHWSIEPVKITAHWLQGAFFDHKSHAQAACDKCHDVRTSVKSADISIPALATCRSCHSGAKAVKGKVRSACEMCHSFHQHSNPLAQSAAVDSAATLPVAGAPGSR